MRFLQDLVAAAAMDLFRGNAVSRIEKMVREARGMPEVKPMLKRVYRKGWEPKLG